MRVIDPLSRDLIRKRYGVWKFSGKQLEELEVMTNQIPASHRAVSFKFLEEFIKTVPKEYTTADVVSKIVSPATDETNVPSMIRRKFSTTIFLYAFANVFQGLLRTHNEVRHIETSLLCKPQVRNINTTIIATSSGGDANFTLYSIASTTLCTFTDWTLLALTFGLIFLL